MGVRADRSAAMAPFLSGSSSQGLLFKANPAYSPKGYLIREDGELYDSAHFAARVATPASLSFCGEPFSAPPPPCYFLPLRLRGEHLYALPQEWEELTEVLGELIETEHGINPRVIQDYYTYLTVETHLSQAGDLIGSDELQSEGTRYPYSPRGHKITRSYFYTSQGGIDVPTSDFLSLEEFGFDPGEGFEMQRHCAHYKSMAEHFFVFMDGYCLYLNGRAEYNSPTTTIRLIYSQEALAPEGATHNSMLAYSFAPTVSKPSLPSPRHDLQARMLINNFLENGRNPLR